jgi:hypothetical protein
MAITTLDWMQPYYEAAQTEIEREAGKKRQLSLEDLARRGVRTSGISEYPLGQITEEEQRQLGLTAQKLAGQKAGLDWQAQQQELQRQWQAAEAEKQYQRQLNLWNLQKQYLEDQARKQQEAQWWQLGLSGLTGLIGGAAGLIPGISGWGGAGLGLLAGGPQVAQTGLQNLLTKEYLSRLGLGTAGSSGGLPPSLSLPNYYSSLGGEF